MTMFHLLITPDDGSDRFEVTAGMRDLVIWERTHKGRSLSQVGDGALTAGMLYEIGFSACTRQQLIPRGTSAPEFFEAYEIDVESEAERTARHAAERLKERIEAGAVPPPVAEPEPDAGDVDEDAPGAGGADPTHSAA